LTAGIHEEVIRGLKFEPDAEFGQKRTFFKRLNLSADFLIYWLICGAFLAMPLGTSPPLICGGLAALVWIVSGKPVIRWRAYVGQSWFWPVAVLILLPWIGLLYSPDPSGFGQDFAGKTYYWLYGFVVAAIPFDRFSSERLIHAYLLGLAVNALVAILQLVGIFPIMNPLAYGLGLGYSTMASYLVLGILMASFYFRETESPKKRILYSLLLGGYFFHLIILGGRAWFFTLLLVSPLVLRNLLGRFKILKMSLAYVAIFGIVLLSPIVRDQISRTIDQIKHHLSMNPDLAWGKEYDETENRLYMWRGAIQIFIEHPLFGVGTGGFPIVLHEKGDPDWPYAAHPHSNFLYMAVSFGLIGILALIWFFWEVFKNAWGERYTPLGFFVGSTALVIFINGLFTTEIVDGASAFLLSVATGLQNGLPKFSGAVTPHLSKAKPKKYTP
jgi:O-antigen ligase